MLLRQAGHEAYATSDVHEALLILRTRPIDLITLGLGSRPLSPPAESLRTLVPEEFAPDKWQYPPMNGEEFLSLLKQDEKLFQIPVILLSGYEREICESFLRAFDLDMKKDIAGYVWKGSKSMNTDLLDQIASLVKRS